MSHNELQILFTRKQLIGAYSKNVHELGGLGQLYHNR
jgi:hypothetical protein